MIDCLFLEGINCENFEKEPTFVNTSFIEDKHYAFTKNPTILFCNPNGAYYETFCRENSWSDFYLDRGVNIMYYNFRGYGRSQGTPTPLSLRKDGVVIINYMRKRMFLTKIGVHG